MDGTLGLQRRLSLCLVLPVVHVRTALILISIFSFFVPFPLLFTSPHLRTSTAAPDALFSRASDSPCRTHTFRMSSLCAMTCQSPKNSKPWKRRRRGFLCLRGVSLFISYRKASHLTTAMHEARPRLVYDRSTLPYSTHLPRAYRPAARRSTLAQARAGSSVCRRRRNTPTENRSHTLAPGEHSRRRTPTKEWEKISTVRLRFATSTAGKTTTSREYYKDTDTH